MQTNDSSILQKVYLLLKEVIPEINRFPKNQKFTLGDRLQNQISDLLEAFIKAYYKPKSEKLPLLREANIQLEIIRHYFRLGFDLGLYNSLKYNYFAEKLQEIGKMTGGWLNSLEKN